MNFNKKLTVLFLTTLVFLGACGSGQNNSGWSDEDIRSTVSLVGNGPAAYVVDKGCSEDDAFYTLKAKGAKNTFVKVKKIDAKIKGNCRSSASILDGDKIMQVGKSDDNRNFTASVCDDRNKIIFTRKNNVVDLTVTVKNGEC